MKRTLAVILLIISGIILAGCLRPYVVDIQQGNVLDTSALTSLQLGMTKDQVRSIMGTPILINTFEKDCWSYAYTNQINGGSITKQHLDLYFESNVLVKYVGDPAVVKLLKH